MAKRPIRVFLDSNIIQLGLFSSKGAPSIIFDILSLKLPFLIWMTGLYNILEIERNFAKKLTGVFSLHQKYLLKLDVKILPFPTQREMQKFAGDHSDKSLPVLVSALLSNANFLVTGDAEEYHALNKHLNFPSKIVSQIEFTDRILPDILKNLS
jgi:predicted nucleic acid-binding protein